MGYLHITNLYRPEAQDILLYKEVYALEKLHGTSTHIGWKDNQIRFFSGGIKHENFIKLFNEADLITKFKSIGLPEVIVYGEGYGGKEQGMRATYGDNLKFIAFDVKVGDKWLTVPEAEDFVVNKLGLEFVYYEKVSTKLSDLDAQRDAPSVQAKRNGILEPKMREGIVIRPLIELNDSRGNRVIVKHKRDEFKETKTPRVVNPEDLKVLVGANKIAEEWVTPMRLEHILGKMESYDITKMPEIIKAMLEDVYREGAGEFIDSKDVRKSIGSMTVKLFKIKLQQNLIDVVNK